MSKLHLYDKILSPLVTEKSTNLSVQNKIVFKVPSGANKKNLKSNIEIKTVPPRRDLELDALVEVLTNDRKVHCHSYIQIQAMAVGNPY